MTVPEVYVLMDIWGFWDDSHTAPATIVSLHLTLEQAILAASEYRHHQAVEDGEPDRPRMTFEREDDAIQTVLSDEDSGEMQFAIQKASLPAHFMAALQGSL